MAYACIVIIDQCLFNDYDTYTRYAVFDLGPGLFFILPCVDTYSKVDLRTVTFDVPPQEILTRDSVTVAVDAVVYFRIFNAVISITNVEDAAKSTKLLAATTLRNVTAYFSSSSCSIFSFDFI